MENGPKFEGHFDSPELRKNQGDKNIRGSEEVIGMLGATVKKYQETLNDLDSKISDLHYDLAASKTEEESENIQKEIENLLKERENMSLLIASHMTGSGRERLN